MASSRISKNNALAGLFVLICIGLFVLVIVLLTGGGSRIMSTSPYVIEFTLVDGADGLERGSVVKLGGKKVGRVTSSEFVFDPADPRKVVGVEVGIEIRSDLQLYEDASVNLVRPLLGTNSTINISSLGSVSGSRPVAEGARIKGRLGPPGFLTQADYARVQNVLARVDKWSLEIDPHIKPIAEDLQATVTSARELTQKASTSWDRWSTQVDEVVTTVKTALEPAEAIVKSVKEGVQQVRDFVSRTDELLARNRPRIDQAIDDAGEILRKYRGEAYDRVMSLLDTAEKGLTHAANVARDADELVTTKAPELKEIVASASLAAQELKLTMQEVRAAPWRLLYQPNKKELENELLYNSIRAYSRSLGEVRAAAQALEAATQNIARTPEGRTPAITPDQLAALASNLKESLSRSQEQERQFFDRWMRDNP